MRGIVLTSAIVHAGLLALLVRASPPRGATRAGRVDTVEFTLAPAPQPVVAARPVIAPRPAIARAAPPVAPSVAHATHAPAPAPRAPAPRAAAIVAVAPRPEPVALPTAVVAPPPAMQASALVRDVAGLDPSMVLLPAAARATTARTDPGAQARTVVQGYVAELLADASDLEPANVHAYYGALARRMRETWRPGFYRTPDMVDTLLALPRAMVGYAQRYNSRASAFGAFGRLGDAPATPIPTDFEDRSSFSTRTTESIVEVEQDDAGVVRSIRVVRPARVRDFDDAALEAVRIALPQEPPVRVPGGRRSRWAFEVAASRDAILPFAGMTFNESNGFFEMHYPGALHVRTRVRPIGSRPLDAPWPLPHRR